MFSLNKNSFEDNQNLQPKDSFLKLKVCLNNYKINFEFENTQTALIYLQNSLILQGEFSV